jgi:hypothetical protein
MSRSDSWVAVSTEPAAEYTAQVELLRLGLNPYLPQFRRSWLPQKATKPLVRANPLFPRYLFLPLSEARVPGVHYARGLRRPKPILADAEGRPWLAPGDVIFNLAQMEHQGVFDEGLATGDRVHLRSKGPLSGVDMFFDRAAAGVAELFLPLFGGCRGVASTESLVKA